MTVKEVKRVEEIVNSMAEKNEAVFARETPLSDAKSIQGLRAVFDEVSKYFLFKLFSFFIFNNNIILFKCLLQSAS